MSNSTLLNSLVMSALVFGLCVTRTVQAQSRDTGVSVAIAQQGNQALQLIKSELTLAIQLFKPKPNAPRTSTNRIKQASAGGPATGLAANARCAE